MGWIDSVREADQKPNLRPVPTPRPAGGGNTRGLGYAGAALKREADAVRSAASGTRNDALNRAAFSLGQLVAGGELTEHQVVAELTNAAQAAGLDDREITATIRSGMSKGTLNPRTAPRDVILRGTYETKQQAEQAHTWAEPEPLTEEAEDADAFPVEALPNRVRRYVEALAEQTQTPVELAAMTALGALSVAAANRAWIAGGGGWVEPLVLWSITVLPPASRKSAVTDAVARPLYSLERSARLDHEAEHAGDADRLIIAEKRKEKLLRDAGQADGELAEQWAEIEGISAEIERLTPRPAPRFLLDDFTPEALAVALRNNSGHVGVITAEGGVFGALTGRYTQGTPQLDLVLKSYDGSPYRADRVGREPISVDRPAVTLSLSVQPDVLAETTKTPALKERGLMGRFCYAVPVDTVGARTVDAPDMPAAAAEEWRELLQYVAAMPAVGDDDDQRVMVLDADALEAHRGYRATLEPRLAAETGDLAYMADWAGKHAGRILRIAGLLHLAKRQAPERPVSFDTMRAALEIGDVLLQHAQKVYGAWRAPAQNVAAAKALAWIGRTGRAEFTVRDAWQGLRGQSWCASSEDVREALVTLAEYGWITTVERVMADGKRKMRDGTFLAHPAAIGGR
jgi:hypothetical protein